MAKEQDVELIEPINAELLRPRMYLVFKPGKTIPPGLAKAGASRAHGNKKFKDGTTRAVLKNWIPDQDDLDAMTAEIAAGNADLKLAETLASELASA